MKHIHFVGRNLSDAWSDLAELDENAIDTQAERFRGGVNNWIIQTYLRLRQALLEAGVMATISDQPVLGAVNITHRDTLKQFSGQYRNCYVIGIRADRPPIQVCDWEILQNDLHAMHAHQRHLPFWPQPGLIPRAPELGKRIERIAYFGRTGTLSAWMSTPSFHAALKDIGVRFEIHEDRWFDYSNVDLVLAHRHEAPVMLEQKPPSKLINAWHAGVPALLGYEPAFERLRQSALDYFSVDSAEEVIAAVQRLQNEEGLYQSMVENGLRRRLAFSVEAIRQRWLGFLLNEVMPDAERVFEQGFNDRHGWLASAMSTTIQKIQSRWFKTRHHWQRLNIQQGYELEVLRHTNANQMRE
jgi:hypothetical protein